MTNREEILRSLLDVLPSPPPKIDNEEDAKKLIDTIVAIERLLAMHISIYDELYGRGNMMLTAIEGLIKDYRELQEDNA